MLQIFLRLKESIQNTTKNLTSNSLLDRTSFSIVIHINHTPLKYKIFLPILECENYISANTIREHIVKARFVTRKGYVYFIYYLFYVKIFWGVNHTPNKARHFLY